VSAHAAERPRAIFVDDSGRRARLVRRIFWVLSALATAYVVLVLVALVVPAGLGRLAVPGLGSLLPGPAAPSLSDAAGPPQRPSSLLASPSATASASASPTTVPTTAPSSAATSPTTAATTAPLPAPSATVPAGAATAPGQTATTSPSVVRPTPKSTNAASNRPHKTKG